MQAQYEKAKKYLVESNINVKQKTLDDMYRKSLSQIRIENENFKNNSGGYELYHGDDRRRHHDKKTNTIKDAFFKATDMYAPKNITMIEEEIEDKKISNIQQMMVNVAQGGAYAVIDQGVFD